MTMPNQAETDHNKGQEDAANDKGYHEPVGFLKEWFFDNGPERNADYDTGYRNTQDQQK